MFVKTTPFEATELAFYDAWINRQSAAHRRPVYLGRPVLVVPNPNWPVGVFRPRAGKRLLRVVACAGMPCS